MVSITPTSLIEVFSPVFILLKLWVLRSGRGWIWDHQVPLQVIKVVWTAVEEEVANT